MPNWKSSEVLMAALGPTWEALGVISGSFLGRLGPQGSQLGARGDPKTGSARSRRALGSILEIMFGLFSGHFRINFFDCFFERVLVSNWFNFGALLEPCGT